MSADELAATSSARPLEFETSPASTNEARREQRLRGMVKQHLPTVWRFLRRLGLEEADADDAVQEVTLVVMRKLDQIEPRCERQYLLRTAYRVGCRMRARRPQVGDEGLEDPIPHPDVLVDQKRARALLDEILERMNVEQRTVFVLHDIEGLTMAEIADALELSPGTVASRLRRAREDFDRRVGRVEASLETRRRTP